MLFMLFMSLLSRCYSTSLSAINANKRNWKYSKSESNKEGKYIELADVTVEWTPAIKARFYFFGAFSLISAIYVC